MAPGSLTEAWISSMDFRNREKIRSDDKRTTEETVKKLEASTVNSKLEFFRSMGLEFSNCCDINLNNNNNYNYDESYELQTICTRSYRSSSRISDGMVEGFEDTSEVRLGWDSRRKKKTSKNSRINDMLGVQKTVPLVRECSVTIVGEKCKICGRSFKCIWDVEIHMKKKHRRRKPRKKLVLKIGNEIISRLPIKRKHLKWHHKEKHRTIDSSDDATSLWNEEEIHCDRIGNEDVASLVDRDCDDRNEARTRLMDVEESAILLEDSRDTSRLELENLEANEEEEIQVVLKITRPRKSMEINHETPNRTERELLISDAIREFVRMDNSLVGMIVPTDDDLQDYRADGEIVEEFSRLPNSSRLHDGNLDGEERNCSFHIDNENDIDCCQEVNSLLQDVNEGFNEDTASLHSEHYRNENGDIIPDFIDYTHCLDDRASHHRGNHNNNNNDNINNGYELVDRLFYNEACINQWNKTKCDQNPVGFDVHGNTSRSLDSLVLIKEEILLDDLLL